MRTSRMWLSVLLLALVAAARAEEQKKVAVSEADDMGRDEKETVATAESRPLQPLPPQPQVAEDRLDDRDKRQLPGQQQYRPLPNLGGSPPQGFRSAPVREQSDGLGLSLGLGNGLPSTVSPVHLVRQSPQPAQVAYRALPSAAPPAGPVRRPGPGPQQTYTRAQPTRQQFADLQQVSEEALSEELEQEKEEPDRLTELLPHSKFACQGRGTGYYADEGLACEVFHYCQDGARHSWVCPEGFTFHQVHLICMPPSSDNICQKSSSYFFVNEYLYRPVNEEEVQRKPNVSLRYSDRYYPQNYYSDPEGDLPQQQQQQLQSRHVPQRVPLQQGLPQQQLQQQQQQQARRTVAPAPVQYQTTARSSLGGPIQQQPQYRQANPSNQVFHSPEEVNIPLQLRRPSATTARSFQPTAAPSSDEYDDDEPVYRQG